MQLNKGARWSLQPFKGADLKIGTNAAPNWFHRIAQRLMLGFIWTRQKGKYE